MSRKEIDVQIIEEGRDHGKVFHITEMSAIRAERWGARAISALARTGVDIGNLNPSMGMQAVAAAGFTSLLQVIGDSSVQVLMDEMMGCVTVRAADPRILPRPLTEDDIEEVATLLKLRLEVLHLHMGFSLAELFQRSSSASLASN